MYNTDTYLYNKAEEIGNNPKLLKKRIQECISVLNTEYKKHFKSYTFDFEKKRFISNTSNFILQWRNTGRTSEGLVCVYKT